MLLLAAAPLAVSQGLPSKGEFEPDLGSLQGQVGSTQDEAQRRADEAKSTVTSEVKGTRWEAEGEAGSARLLVEDTVLTAWEALVDAFGVVATTVDRAVGIVQGLLGDLLSELNPPKTGGDGADDGRGLRAQSVGAAISRPSDPASILLMAASGGALLLLATLLRRLAGLGLLPFLSRISHDEIYDNDARRAINELVVAEPGLCLNDLVERLGHSRNAVSYHLFVLEKEEAIVSIKDGKYRRYFTRNGKYVNGAKNVVAALRNGTTLAMARAVVARPGTIQRDLCVELGATPSAACWHAKRLLDLGVIRKERVANTVRYFPGESLSKYDLREFGLGPSQAVPASP